MDKQPVQAPSSQPDCRVDANGFGLFNGIGADDNKSAPFQHEPLLERTTRATYWLVISAFFVWLAWYCVTTASSFGAGLMFFGLAALVLAVPLGLLAGGTGLLVGIVAACTKFLFRLFRKGH